jgi:hypothetical protein
MPGFYGSQAWGMGLIALKYCHIVEESPGLMYSQQERWEPTDPAYHKFRGFFVRSVLPEFQRIFLVDLLHNSTEISLYIIVANLINSQSPNAQSVT